MSIAHVNNNGDLQRMTRLLIIVLVVTMIGCTQSSDTTTPESSSNSMPTETITNGRVTLLTHKIEAGNPNPSAIQTGLKAATSTLNELLANPELKPATGIYIGRFRLDANGIVRMFLTDKATAISNIGDGKLDDAFGEATFGGKYSFPEIGDITMVYAEFKITPPK